MPETAYCIPDGLIMVLFSKNASQGTSETKWFFQLWLTNQARILLLFGTSSGQSPIYNIFFSLVWEHSFVLPVGEHKSEQSGEEKRLCCSVKWLHFPQVSDSSPKKLIQHQILSDVESANVFLLTTEATWEFHAPKFGDLEK